MNEKNGINLFINLYFIIIAFMLGGATGFIVGRGNFIRSAELERANRELTTTIGELRDELDRERAITEKLGSKQAEERILIKYAIDACRRAGNGVQGVIAKMEILNALIVDLERRAGGGADLPGSEQVNNGP